MYYVGEDGLGTGLRRSGTLCVRIFKINVLPWLLASPFMYLRALGSVYYLVIWQSAFICGLNFIFCPIRSVLWRLELANWRGGEFKVTHRFSCNWSDWIVVQHSLKATHLFPCNRRLLCNTIKDTLCKSSLYSDEFILMLDTCVHFYRIDQQFLIIDYDAKVSSLW